MDVAEAYTPAWAGALAYLEQPVFFVRAGSVVYQNAAADRLLCGARLSLEGAMPHESMNCYRSFDGTGTMLLTMRLAGAPYGVTVSREGDVDLFVAGAAPLDGEGHAGVIERAARSIRDILNELLDVSGAIAPAAEDPAYCRELERLNRSICRLTRMTGSMSDYEALLTGRRKPRFRRVELVGEVRAQCERLSALTARTGVTVEFSCMERSITAAIDRELLEQALLNLAANALRAGRVGRIKILLSRGGTHVLLRVEDDGEGMRPYELASALSTERFLSPLDDARRGVGLGLSLAYRIARVHEGTLVLQSAPGAGTAAVLSFSLRLRAGPDDALNAPSALRGLDPFLVALSDVLPLDEFGDIV